MKLFNHLEIKLFESLTIAASLTCPCSYTKNVARETMRTDFDSVQIAFQWYQSQLSKSNGSGNNVI